MRAFMGLGVMPTSHETIWRCSSCLILWGTVRRFFLLTIALSVLLQCSKLGPKDQGEKAMEGALHSLSQLDLDYIDLYLIHWPGTQGLVVADERNPGKEFI